jgi:exopolysaccharide/PEP-CTERM locus tyrosine autokinase
MSIVEKALGKLREPGSVATPLAGRTPQSGRRGLSSAPAVPKSATRNRTNVIRVSRDVLRAEGLLPEPTLAYRTTEEFRRIKWPLVLDADTPAAPDKPPHNLLMVTSALPGEGKTFTALNLAMVIAKERDSSVLLVDCDLAKPRLSRVLGLEGAPGMTDVLTSETLNPEEVIVGTDIAGIEILPSGKPTAVSPELVASRRMSDVLQMLASEGASRIVLFDTPPLLSTNEAHVLAPQLAHVLMVVRADHTPRTAVQEALALLDGHDSVNLALNQAVHGLMGERYGYGKYGYAYSEEESEAGNRSSTAPNTD